MSLLALLLPLAVAIEVSAADPASSPTPEAAGSAVSVYFLRDDQVATAHRAIEPPTREVATAAMRALLAGPTEVEREAGLATGIPAGTELRGIGIDAASKVATVDLSAAFAAAESGQPPAGRLAQVVYTLTQFPSIAAVRLRIEGKTTDAFAGAGADADEAVDRAAFEAQTPPIFVESPAVGDVVGSPLRVEGTANTFEGAFVLTVVDAAGVVLAEEAVQAASGSGTRGTFAVDVTFAVDRPIPGKLVVFERAASAAGERVNVVEIPLDLED